MGFISKYSLKTGQFASGPVFIQESFSRLLQRFGRAIAPDKSMCTVQRLALAGFMMASPWAEKAPFQDTASLLPPIEVRWQLDHALEMFGRGGVSHLLTGFSTDLRPFLLKNIQASLPRRFRHQAFEVATAVINEANRNNIDPLFLMAVIETESHFNVRARGRRGEVGLMQILPSTAQWLAPQVGLAPGFDLENPAINIRLGARYFSSLRERFGGVTGHYVSAYNMGARNVRGKLASNVQPRGYLKRVLKNYDGFYQKLSDRRESLLAVMHLPPHHTLEP